MLKGSIDAVGIEVIALNDPTANGALGQFIVAEITKVFKVWIVCA